jgi:hypothetical protein
MAKLVVIISSILVLCIGSLSHAQIKKDSILHLALDSASLKAINGSYTCNLWRIIVPFGRKGENVSASDKVDLVLVSPTLLVASLIKSGKVVSRRSISGNLRNGCFWAKKKIVLIPIPFFFTCYYSGRTQFSLTTEGDLWVHTAYYSFVMILMAADNRVNDTFAFKRVN